MMISRILYPHITSFLNQHPLTRFRLQNLPIFLILLRQTCTSINNQTPIFNHKHFTYFIIIIVILTEKLVTLILGDLQLVYTVAFYGLFEYCSDFVEIV